MRQKVEKVGVHAKKAPKMHRLTVRFDDFEYDKMLRMYEKSGYKAKAVFIKERLFNRKFKVTTINNTVREYYAKLSDLHAQFRRIGANYNQVVATLRTHFSERKAMTMLYKLEKLYFNEQIEILVSIFHTYTLNLCNCIEYSVL